MTKLERIEQLEKRTAFLLEVVKDHEKIMITHVKLLKSLAVNQNRIANVIQQIGGMIGVNLGNQPLEKVSIQ